MTCFDSNELIIIIYVSSASILLPRLPEGSRSSSAISSSYSGSGDVAQPLFSCWISALAYVSTNPEIGAQAANSRSKKKKERKSRVHSHPGPHMTWKTRPELQVQQRLLRPLPPRVSR